MRVWGDQAQPESAIYCHWTGLMDSLTVTPDLWTCPVNPHLMHIGCNIYLFIYFLQMVTLLSPDRRMIGELATRQSSVSGIQYRGSWLSTIVYSPTLTSALCTNPAATLRPTAERVATTANR
jgi:hypothetical protein